MSKKIKIVDNPYNMDISYYISDEKSGDELIGNDNSSDLGNLHFKKCFLPFNASNILEELRISYADNNGNLEIIFEGTSDELKELKEAQSISTNFEKIKINEGDRYLNNGRDVIEDIHKIFKELKILIEKTDLYDESMGKSIEKYSDAANDSVPICVIGTVSSGKSTFINALLGGEYLPKAAGRCTAKLYKVEKSKYIDRAKISFKYKGELACINLMEKPQIEGKIPPDFRDLLNNFSSEKDLSLAARINRYLTFLNSYDGADCNSIGDIISIEVPFNSSVLKDSVNQLIIFDTPGSDNIDNKKDFELLKNQMHNLTNGLPIFITDWKGLSIDASDTLITELQSIENLDQRFTIVIVNKADNTFDVKEYDVEKIKQTNAVKKLKEKGLQGIYFLTALFGLGFKNNGQFINKEDSRNYRKDKDQFDNSLENTDESEFTKRFYEYNILAPQIKARFDSDKESEHPDPVYLNSGLYSIEKEIVNFANIYSAYNKSTQAYNFLNKVFEDINRRIKELSEEKERSITIINRIIKDNEKKLLESIKEKLEEAITQLSDEKQNLADKISDELLPNSKFNESDLKNDFASISSQQYIESSISSSEKEAKDLSEAAKKKLTENVAKLGENVAKLGGNLVAMVKREANITEAVRPFSEIGESAKNILTNIAVPISAELKFRSEKQDVDKKIYKENIKYVKAKYYAILSESNSKIHDKSCEYWTNNSEKLRTNILEFITESNLVSDIQKSQLKSAILEFKSISLEKPDLDFVGDFKYRRWFSRNIDSDSLCTDLNVKIGHELKDISKKTISDHFESFKEWTEQLITTARASVDKLNPTLITLSKSLSELEAEKANFLKIIKKVGEYKVNVESLIEMKDKEDLED